MNEREEWEYIKSKIEEIGEPMKESLKIPKDEKGNYIIDIKKRKDCYDDKC